MSKKKSKKFRKIKSHSNAQVTETKTETFISSDPALPEEAVAPKEEAQEKETDPYENKEYDHVKRDVKKILLIVSILIALFVGIYFLGAKTTVLKSLGNWLYRILNITAG